MIKHKNLLRERYKFPRGKTFVVAEMSGNHGMSLKKAKKIILAAKRAGADAIKLQTFTADTITLDSNKKDFSLNHLKNNKKWRNYKTYYNLYKNNYTPWSWHKSLFKYARKNKLIIFSSPFDETAVDLLEKLKCPIYKIASPEITHIPLIKKVAKTGKPLMISTGLANLKDISLAVKTAKSYGNSNITLLKCNSTYPAPIEESNLLNIQYLKKKFNLPCGLSDHTLDDLAAITSVAVGGCVIEKHIKLSNDSKSIDSFFSMTENNFKLMIDRIRMVEKILGKNNYQISKSSKLNFKSRRSIYVSKNLKRGDKLNKNNIKIVRPGLSIHPKHFLKLINKKVKKNLTLGSRINISLLYK